MFLSQRLMLALAGVLAGLLGLVVGACGDGDAGVGGVCRRVDVGGVCRRRAGHAGH